MHHKAASRLSTTPSIRIVRHLLLAMVAIGLLSIGQAVAEEGKEAVSEPAKPGKDGKVCEYQAVTGSRMKKRICHTPEQWEARQRAAKQVTRELDNRPIAAEGSG